MDYQVVLKKEDYQRLLDRIAQLEKDCGVEEVENKRIKFLEQRVHSAEYEAKLLQDMYKGLEDSSFIEKLIWAWKTR